MHAEELKSFQKSLSFAPTTCCPHHKRMRVLHFQSLRIPGHDPFVLRKLLVLLSAIPGGAAGYFLDNELVAVATYFVLVTVLDWIGHALLKLRPSQDADPEKLMLSEGVTPAQFDAYFETRLWIRCASLSAAFVLGALALVLTPTCCLEAFCGSYILSTLVGILWVRFFLKIPHPTLFYRHEQCYMFYPKDPLGRDGTDISLATTERGQW